VQVPYCVVPYVRGREQSRSAVELEAEVKSLVKQGYRQLTFVGQNVNSYHDGGTDFHELLRRLSAAPGLKRARFTTSHPKDMSEQLMLAMAETPSVCEHLHLPLQAGSDEVLARMGRGYSGADYLRLLAKARSIVPGLAVSTDLMVGFPGESERDFQDTLELVRQARFNLAFNFAYTDRPMAKAASFSDKVEPAEKRERLRKLNELQDSISRELSNELVGKRVSVLVEGENPKQGGWRGRTRTNYLVLFTGQTAPGCEVEVEVASAKTWTLLGRRV
jgi:tRNA-2-methylthio-N6-dimethylallyladenosine synthase